MTFSERDLRDALAPLGGDPVRDAARVLGSLPPIVPVVPHDPCRGKWWLAGAGVVLGLVIGVLVAPAKEKQAGQPTAPPGPEVPVKKEEPPKPPTEREGMMLTAYGGLRAFEPGIGEQPLDTGNWMLRNDSRLVTTEGLAGVYVFANDLQVRLDRNTDAVIGFDIKLGSGRVCMTTGMPERRPKLFAGLCEVELQHGAAIVHRVENEVYALCQWGEVVVRSKQGSRTITTAQEVVVTLDGRIGEPRIVPFLGSVTSWMTPLIKLQQDDREYDKRIAEMIAAYEAGQFRAEAATEIRKLGDRCVPRLVESVRARMDDADYTRATASLIAAVLSYDRGGFAMLVLESPDVETRLITFRRLVQCLGDDGDTNEQFWREAGESERIDAIKEWQRKHRGK